MMNRTESTLFLTCPLSNVIQCGRTMFVFCTAPQRKATMAMHILAFPFRTATVITWALIVAGVRGGYSATVCCIVFNIFPCECKTTVKTSVVETEKLIGITTIGDKSYQVTIWYQMEKAATHIKSQLISDDTWFQIKIICIDPIYTT